MKKLLFVTIIAFMSFFYIDNVNAEEIQHFTLNYDNQEFNVDIPVKYLQNNYIGTMSKNSSTGSYLFRLFYDFNYVGLRYSTSGTQKDISFYFKDTSDAIDSGSVNALIYNFTTKTFTEDSGVYIPRFALNDEITDNYVPVDFFIKYDNKIYLDGRNINSNLTYKINNVDYKKGDEVFFGGSSIRFGIVDSETEVINGITYYKSKTVRMTLQGKNNTKYYYEYTTDNGASWITLLLTQKDYFDIKFTTNTVLLVRIRERNTFDVLNDYTFTLSGIATDELTSEYEEIPLRGHEGIILYAKNTYQDLISTVYMETGNIHVTKYSNGKIVQQMRDIAVDFQVTLGPRDTDYYLIKNNDTSINTVLRVLKDKFAYYYLNDALSTITIENPNTGEAEVLGSIYESEQYYKDHVEQDSDVVENNWLLKILKMAFVPDLSAFNNLVSMFNRKFGIFSQLASTLPDLFQFGGEDPPEFNMTIYGTTVNIVDFSAFEIVRTFLHGLILAFAWYGFIRRCYERAPAFIGGFFSFERAVGDISVPSSKGGKK